MRDAGQVAEALSVNVNLITYSFEAFRGGSRGPPAQQGSRRIPTQSMLIESTSVPDIPMRILHAAIRRQPAALKTDRVRCGRSALWNWFRSLCVAVRRSVIASPVINEQPQRPSGPG